MQTLAPAGAAAMVVAGGGTHYLVLAMASQEEQAEMRAFAKRHELLHEI